MRLFGAIATGVLLGISACSVVASGPVPAALDGGTLDATVGDAAPTKVTVGAAGGTLSTPEGVILVVPPGALSGDTVITIAPATDAPPAPAEAPLAGPAFLFGPEGTVFAKPITLTLPVDPKLLPAGTTVADVRASTALAGMPTFQPIDARALDDTHVQVLTRHFSYYAASRAPRPATNECAPSCDNAKDAFDACLSCGVGFHPNGLAQGVNACKGLRDGYPGIRCERDCGDSYHTTCAGGCSPGYHATTDGRSGDVQCNGWLELTCERDQGPEYQTCQWGCAQPYIQQGTGVALCMAGDHPSRCVLGPGAAATCALGASDSGLEGGVSVEAGRDAGGPEPDSAPPIDGSASDAAACMPGNGSPSCLMCVGMACGAAMTCADRDVCAQASCGVYCN